MAISKGKESVASEFKRYIGVAPCFIKAINPNKAELKALGVEVDEEPVYVSTKEVDGKEVRSVRITVWLQPNEAKVGFKVAPISVSYSLTEAPRYNNDKTKIQVIDKYAANDKNRGIVARTAWPTLEEAKNHATVLTGNNGPYQSSISCEYRPIYQGEEDLINLLIAYLCIPSVTAYNSEEKKWYTVANPEDSECRLDCIKDYFNGDVTELREAIALQPNNEVKIMFGVRTADDGKQYQTACTRMYLRNSQTNYSKLDAFLQNEKKAGRYSNVEFSATPFKEYKVEATEFTPTEAENPFNTTTSVTANSELPFEDPFA